MAGSAGIDKGRDSGLGSNRQFGSQRGLRSAYHGAIMRPLTRGNSDDGENMVNDDNPPCDECDKKRVNVNLSQMNERQRRFIEAYRLQPIVSRAARLSGVHRATVYRWL